MRTAVVLVVGMGAALICCDELYGVSVIDAPVIDGTGADLPGCADGNRDGFTDTAHPKIAACGGGWTVGGLAAPRTRCAPAPGNDGANPSGTGCSAADLCSAGWHVCSDHDDVEPRLAGSDCTHVHAGFYATNQPSASPTQCGSGGSDGGAAVFGCLKVPQGTLVGCAPLTDSLGAMCAGSAGGAGEWSCADPNDRTTVTKGSGPGGVLCCEDD